MLVEEYNTAMDCDFDEVTDFFSNQEIEEDDDQSDIMELAADEYSHLGWSEALEAAMLSLGFDVI